MPPPTIVSPTWHFVFVHGAMHGGWCWYKIRTRLERLGHKVTCLDLTSAGRDITDANTVFKFADYNKPLIDFMSSLSDQEKVVLVGHSVGGLSITYCVQEYWAKISVAIYVCAAMLATGGGGPPTSDFDKYELAFDNEGPTSMLLKEEYQRDILYHLSPIEDSTLASMLLRPSPIRPLVDATLVINNIGEDANSVKRVFIKTLADRNFDPDNQDQTIEAWPPTMVLKVTSDHSPFFSTPDQLVLLLLEAVA